MEEPTEMLPAVAAFLASLRKEMNDVHATEKDIKAKMKLLTAQVNKEVEVEVAKGKNGPGSRGTPWGERRMPGATSRGPSASTNRRWKMS